MQDRAHIVVNLHGGTTEQFEQCLRKAMVKAGRISPYKLMPLINKKGVDTGYCHLAFKDMGVHNMLLGRNPDGTNLADNIAIDISEEDIVKEINKEVSIYLDKVEKEGSYYKDVAPIYAVSHLICVSLSGGELEKHATLIDLIGTSLDEIRDSGIETEGWEAYDIFPNICSVAKDLQNPTLLNKVSLIGMYFAEELDKTVDRLLEKTVYGKVIWADIADIEDDVRSKYKKVTKQESLMVLPSFQYTPEQIKKWEEITGEKSETTGTFKIFEGKWKDMCGLNARETKKDKKTGKDNARGSRNTGGYGKRNRQERGKRYNGRRKRY